MDNNNKSKIIIITTTFLNCVYIVGLLRGEINERERVGDIFLDIKSRYSNP